MIANVSLKPSSHVLVRTTTTTTTTITTTLFLHPNRRWAPTSIFSSIDISHFSKGKTHLENLIYKIPNTIPHPKNTKFT